MICFPNAKINLGLHVTEKRTDGFHNIETVFYPVGWNDALEIVENNSATSAFNLTLSGIPIHGKLEDNLLFKAYQLINKQKKLPAIDVYLHKALPMGAGLGGGSSDAAYFINLLNTQFQLNLSDTEKMQIAKPLGSDCAFFIKNKPIFAYEKGDAFKDIMLNLKGYYIAIIFPNVHSNTKDAYSLVKPSAPKHSILEGLMVFSSARASAVLRNKSKPFLTLVLPMYINVSYFFILFWCGCLLVFIGSLLITGLLA